MKSEAIDNKTIDNEWKVPCLVQQNDHRKIVLITGENLNTYHGIVVSLPMDSVWNLGEFIDGISPTSNWTLYDGKVILSNN
jgi:hypothetical protein